MSRSGRRAANVALVACLSWGFVVLAVPTTADACGVPASGDTDCDGLLDGADPCPNDALNACFGTIAVDRGTGKEVRLNANQASAPCTGPRTDCRGLVWNADFNSNTGSSAGCDLPNGCPVDATNVFGCTDVQTEEIFKCEHYDDLSPPEMQYSFDVPNGTYLVNLLFMNSYTQTTTVGSRIFNVALEDVVPPQLDHFDQVAAAGGSGIPVVRAAIVTVVDGNGLQIQFQHTGTENPAFKGIEVMRQGVCGDGVVDDTEECDGGGCCSNCRFVTAGTACRAVAGVCDLAESCDGTTAACPPDAKSTAVCRAGVGACDADESCDGVTDDCPPDQLSPPGAVCRPAAGACDLDDTCDGSTANCAPDAKSTGVCRAAAGVCDVAESCDGTADTCPADSVQPAGGTCRPAAGVCDVAESCDGTSGLCPPDQKSLAVCRAAAFPCDGAESCDGTGDDCPPDVLASAGTVCRAAAGACDLAETCDGSTAVCPPDAKSTAVCRAAADVCDVAETCDGTGDTCPTDVFVPGGTLCRASAGVCDLAESCTGSSGTCPPDAKSTAVCRAGTDVCDASEHCDGTGDDCPVDVLASAGTVCRTAAGECDVAETCNGSSASCPADVKTTGVCRPATGACDVAESCDGSSDVCPSDQHEPDGTPCNDADACTAGDVCTAGVCAGTPEITACLDDFLCYKAKATGFKAAAGVRLVDAFEDAVVDVVKAKRLCTPASGGGAPVDPVMHLACYQIRQTSAHKKRNIHVTNALGGVSARTVKPDFLLVPSAEGTSPPAPPDLAGHHVDHYKCYRLKGAKPAKTNVAVADEFTGAAKRFILKKPKHLCLPVDESGAGVTNPSASLLCYVAVSAPGQPKHAPRTGLYVANQLGETEFGTRKEAELCLPSTGAL